MPGIVDGVRGGFISSTKMKVRVDGLDVEGENFVLAVSESESEGDIGTKDVPEDVGE